MIFLQPFAIIYKFVYTPLSYITDEYVLANIFYLFGIGTMQPLVVTQHLLRLQIVNVE